MAVLLGALVAIAAWADSYVRIVRISYLDQTVEVRRPEQRGGSGRWTQGMLNAPLVEGEQVRTGADGRAEVQLECGSALRLTPDTELNATVLRLSDAGVRESTFQLTSGTLYATVLRGDAADFHLLIPDGSIATTDGKAELRVEVPEGQPANVELLDGHAALEWARRSVKLSKHHRLRLEPGAAVAMGAAAADPWSRWSHLRDQQFQRALNAQFPQPPVDATTSTLPISPAAAAASSDPGSIFTALDPPAVQAPNTSAARLRRVPSCGN